jgi:hypothetical protein
MPAQVDAHPMGSDPHLLDLQFIEARHLVIELAAFLDRCERHGCTDDFRHRALLHALPVLLEDRPDRAKTVLEKLSDPIGEPTTHASAPACGAPKESAI